MSAALLALAFLACVVSVSGSMVAVLVVLALDARRWWEAHRDN